MDTAINSNELLSKAAANVSAEAAGISAEAAKVAAKSKVDELKEQASGYVDAAKTKLSDLKDAAPGAIDGLKDKAKDMAAQALEKGAEFLKANADKLK